MPAMFRKLSRKTWLILALVLVPVAVMIAMIAFETGDGRAPNIHFVVAFGLGATLTVLLAVGLMALSFHSSRSGHDEQIGNEQDSDGA
jgi:RsiW-degrading membrane proteinase PrsW (M82 family)